MRLSQAIEEYLLHFRATAHSLATIDLYRHYLGTLTDFLSDPAVTSIEFDDLEEFLDYLAQEYVPKRPGGDKSPLSDSSILNCWSAIRSFFGWAEKAGLVITRPDEKLIAPDASCRKIHPLSVDEVRGFIQTAKAESIGLPGKTPSHNQRIALPIVYLLLDTGIRVGEVCRLRVKDFDRRNKRIIVQRYGCSRRKTKERYIQISDRSCKILWNYLESRGGVKKTDPMFPSESGGMLSRSAVRHILVGIGKRADIPNVHPHRFRHTYATNFLKNGGDSEELKRTLGHSTWSMVRHYLELTADDVRTSHRKGSPVGNWILNIWG
jgi:integrase/recombinase XerD